MCMPDTDTAQCSCMLLYMFFIPPTSLHSHTLSWVVYHHDTVGISFISVHQVTVQKHSESKILANPLTDHFKKKSFCLLQVVRCNPPYLQRKYTHWVTLAYMCTWVRTASNNLSAVITVSYAAVESLWDTHTHTHTHIHVYREAWEMSDTAALERQRRQGITEGYPLLLQDTLCVCVCVCLRTKCPYKKRKIWSLSIFELLYSFLSLLLVWRCSLCERPWPVCDCVHSPTLLLTIHQWYLLHGPSDKHLMRWNIDFVTTSLSLSLSLSVSQTHTHACAHIQSPPT